jgi:PKD repeat protein
MNMAFHVFKKVENNIWGQKMNNKKTNIIAYFIIGMFVTAAFFPAITADEKDDTNADRGLVTLINEGFESGIPTGWTNTGWILNWYGFAHSGLNWISNSAGGSYMTTSTLAFGDNTELSFWYAVVDGNEPKNLEVYIDDYTNPSNLIWSDYGFTHTDYQQATVDLSSYSDDHDITFFYPSPSTFMPVNLDDILVTTEVDLEPPQISNVDAQPPIQHVGQSVEITCDVTDNEGVDEIYANITYPDSSVHSNLMSGSGSYSYNQIYTIYGIYQYHIYAIDINGNSVESPTYTFEINAIPTADFSYSPTYPSTADTVSFTDLSTDPDGTIVSWDWDFGDDGGSGDQHPFYSYSDDGIYTVTLTVTDDDGATDIHTDTITVTNVGPTADFAYSPISPTTADIVSFTDISTDSDGTIVSWDWDFGDGNSSTAQHPTHQYDGGTYIITLIVTDDDGATDTYADSVTVTNAPPVADFSYLPIEPSILDTVNFTDLSFDIDGVIVSWDWDFGDGDGSTIQHPSHNYSVSDLYSVSLTVTDDDGATDTITKTVNVTPPVGVVDVNQSIQDRGFPIRHTLDSDWAAAQNFTPTLNHISKVELYLRTFGTPEFDMVVELRTGNPQGTLLDTVTFIPAEVPSSWTWFEVDFTDEIVDTGKDYFIVIPPAPSGVTTSFGYEWGYAFGNQYDDGSFWFTRDGGGLWRDLPTMYEFVFKTYGY